MSGVVRMRMIPVEVSAVQFLGGADSAAECIVLASDGQTSVMYVCDEDGTETLQLYTVGGITTVRVGDWVVRGATLRPHAVPQAVMARVYEPLDTAPEGAPLH